MGERPRRIFWLLDHTARCDAEVPLLQSLGFEVYVPRHGTASRRHGDSPAASAGLTIPAREQALLDSCDFHSPWSAVVAHIVDRSFEIVICGFDLAVIDETLSHFHGRIFLRAFGREGGECYSDLLGLRRLARIESLAGRVWFAPALDESIHQEGPVLRRCAIHLPLGVPARMLGAPATWTGADGFLFFICPDIESEPRRQLAYREFCDWFGDLPHRIVGGEGAPVDDSAVLGQPIDATWNDLQRDARVAFYPSRDSRFCSLYPLATVARGIPLIYLRDGWLGSLGELPGACGTLGEARRLVERLLAGDQDLAQRLRSAQQALLDPFRPAAVEAAWRARFLPLVVSPAPAAEPGPTPPAAGERVGLWLELRPDSPLQTEGIGRLLGMWLQGLIGNGCRPVVATPGWAHDQVAEALRGMGIAQDAVEILIPGRVKPLMRVMIWMVRPRTARLSWSRRVWRAVAAAGAAALGVTIRAAAHVIMWSWMTMLVVLLGLGAVGWWAMTRLSFDAGLVVGLALAPLAAVAALIIGWYLGARYWRKRRGSELEDMAGKLRRLRKGDRFAILANPVTRLAARIYLSAIALENQRLVACANARADITRWIVPNPSFASAAGLVRPLLMCVPDLVYLDFPGGFSLHWFAEVERNAHRLAARADAFAAYSADVIRRHVSHLAPGARVVALIRHAPMDYYGMLYDGVPAERAAATRVVDAALHFHGCKAARLAQRSWLARMSLGDVPYLFISSQNRPHKNLLGLLRAFVVLLRVKRISLKLVTTGQLDQVPEVEKFVQEQQLEDDVIALPDVDPATHAAVYRLATLTVCPTLFEGGFPFVFSESVSVGTPVILSRIACVEEMLSPADRDLMTFDPLDPEALAEAIALALAGRQMLIARQRELLDEQRRRTWTTVGCDLLAALACAAEHHRGVERPVTMR